MQWTIWILSLTQILTQILCDYLVVRGRLLLILLFLVGIIAALGEFVNCTSHSYPTKM